MKLWEQVVFILIVFITLVTCAITIIEGSPPWLNKEEKLEVTRCIVDLERLNGPRIDQIDYCERRYDYYIIQKREGIK